MEISWEAFYIAILSPALLSPSLYVIILQGVIKLLEYIDIYASMNIYIYITYIYVFPAAIYIVTYILHYMYLEYIYM